MSVSQKFTTFCSNLRMTTGVVESVQYRYKRITRQLNSDFYGTTSDTANSLYVGSYGRGTAIHVSDIDMIFQLPYSQYKRYDEYYGNGQSALLQAVRDSLRNTYSSTFISGDGQVVKIEFTDNVAFEIVPGFINKDKKSYTYPDSNNGGSWKTTKPRDEIEAIRDGDLLWNKNLRRLCRMARAWKDKWDVPMNGLLIDTLAYNFMREWSHRHESFLYHDWMTRDFFEFLKNQNRNQDYWLALGSHQYVYRKGAFEYKAGRCYNLALEAIQYERDNMHWSANNKWKDIYGFKFPS